MVRRWRDSHSSMTSLTSLSTSHIAPTGRPWTPFVDVDYTRRPTSHRATLRSPDPARLSWRQTIAPRRPRAPRRLPGGARVLRPDCDCAVSGLLWGQHDLVGPRGPSVSQRQASRGASQMPIHHRTQTSPARDRQPAGNRPSHIGCTHSFRTNGGYSDAMIDRLKTRQPSVWEPPRHPVWSGGAARLALCARFVRR